MSPVLARLRRAAFRRELVLALGTIVLIGMFFGLEWLRRTHDRDATLRESMALSHSLVRMAEGTWTATLRDAANAAESAALLIEAGGNRWTEASLHRELKRELWNEQGTARLVFVDPAGRVLASSAEAVPRGMTPLSRASPSYQIELTGNRPFFISRPEPSAFDGELVVPMWCEVRAPFAGWLRAELRMSNFVSIMGPTAAFQNGTIAVIDPAIGSTVFRIPWTEKFAGKPAEQRLVEQLGSIDRDEGEILYRSTLDGANRLFAWRRLPGSELLIARGADEAALLQSVSERSALHVWSTLLASGVVSTLTILFAVYLRRLDRSQLRLVNVEKRFWESLEHSVTGVVVIDAEGTWRYANPAMCEMLGYDLGELLAAPSARHAPPALREARKRLLERYYDTHARSAVGEQALIHRDGHEVWVNIQAHVLEADVDQPLLIICHIEDITERHDAQEALQVLNSELEERVAARTRELELANANLKAFSYSAAHDLRSPLGIIKTYAGLVERDVGTTTPKVRKWLHSISAQAEHMMELIDSLMSLARITQAGMNRVVVDLADEVAQLRADLAEHRADVVASVQWDVRDLPRVMADRAMIRIVLENLVGNAIKYSRNSAPPRVEIASFDTGDPDTVGFVVRDNGVGFDASWTEGLFTPFTRMHSISEFEGSGIGLAIVHRIVDRHGGRVWAEGRVGEGAAFFVELPR